jgi:hypothetical protein
VAKKQKLSFEEMMYGIEEEALEKIVLPAHDRLIHDLKQKHIPELRKAMKGAKKTKSGASLIYVEEMIAKLLEAKELHALESAAELYFKYRDVFDVDVFTTVYKRLKDACDTAQLELDNQNKTR